jgi:hypothetical protein
LIDCQRPHGLSGRTLQRGNCPACRPDNGALSARPAGKSHSLATIVYRESGAGAIAGQRGQFAHTACRRTREPAHGGVCVRASDNGFSIVDAKGDGVITTGKTGDPSHRSVCENKPLTLPNCSSRCIDAASTDRRTRAIRATNNGRCPLYQGAEINDLIR